MCLFLLVISLGKTMLHVLRKCCLDLKVVSHFLPLSTNWSAPVPSVSAETDTSGSTLGMAVCPFGCVSDGVELEGQEIQTLGGGLFSGLQPLVTGRF